jgi:hypothetical protein
MKGMINIPQFDPKLLDISKLLTVTNKSETDRLNAELMYMVQAFVMEFSCDQSFSYGKTKKDFEKIRDSLAGIAALLKSNNWIEDYFVFIKPKKYNLPPRDAVVPMTG